MHVLNSGVVKYTNVVFGTDESVLFREVSLIQGVLIERFHCTSWTSFCELGIVYIKEDGEHSVYIHSLDFYQLGMQHINYSISVYTVYIVNY